MSGDETAAPDVRSASVVFPNFNSAGLVVRAVERMLHQRCQPGESIRIVVVDDGSTDDSAARLESEFGDRILLIRLGSNKGRSTARNAGAAAFDSDVLVFVDSDCAPESEQFVSAHLAAIRAGADASFGAVNTPGPGFWDELQRDAAAWRLRDFEAGEKWTFTTQNVAIRRSRFVDSGGFDPAFDRHGFEDRDLFVRLAQGGCVAVFTPEAAVTHDDVIRLQDVARKLGEAGLHAARAFATKHPGVYRRMAFSRIDCGVHPWLKWVDRCLWPIVGRLLPVGNRIVEWRWLPFRLRALLARAAYGLAFLHGTVLASRRTPA